MFGKYLFPLLTSSLLGLSFSPAIAESLLTSDISFVCESNSDIPITVAKNSTGKMQTIFHWKPEATKITRKLPQELCNDAANRLNEYVAEGNDLSSFNLIPTQVAGLSGICLTKKFKCELVIVTFLPDIEQVFNAATEYLTIILDPQIPIKDILPSDTVVLGAEVNLWELFMHNKE